MARAESTQEINETPNGLEIQFLVVNIKNVNAGALVTGQGPIFHLKSLVTEDLLDTFPDYYKNRKQIMKSKMWSVHKAKLRDDSSPIKWIFTAFYDTRDSDLETKMPSLYGDVLKKADKHVEILATPILGSGRGRIDTAKASEWLLQALFDFVPSKLRTVLISYSDASITDLIVCQFNSLKELRLSSSITESSQDSRGNSKSSFGRITQLYKAFRRNKNIESVRQEHERVFERLSTDENERRIDSNVYEVIIPLTRPKSSDDSTQAASSNQTVSKMRDSVYQRITVPGGSPDVMCRSYDALRDVNTRPASERILRHGGTLSDYSLRSVMLSNRRGSEADIEPITMQGHTQVPDEKNHRFTQDKSEVPKTKLQQETTQSKCVIERAYSSAQIVAHAHEARPSSDVVHRTQDDHIEVKTRPASDINIRRKDRFKIKDGLSETEKIEEYFRSHNGTVLKITPVGTECLTQQYMARCTQLLKRLSKDYLDVGTVQKTLWFNTTPDLIGYITDNGFNRSKCGYDGDYGEGVYFATSPIFYRHKDTRSSRPTSTSPAASRETLYVFKAKVLTGIPSLGVRGIRVVETTEPSNSYDSTVDDLQSPSVYVVYNDTQAEPEYLIEYTLNS